MNFETTLFWFFIVLNIIAFIIMGIDKKKAIKQKWRIPEKTIWTVAILGGSIGAIVGMRFFRHKTKHRMFSIGLPLVLILQIVSFFYFFELF
ncbi:DUF1294 domain-containing protein [Virgibacillus sp. DJP39]|uniref:DUF1294 domain-containing protein n=1 Tax=Virgibacillus sp. DJP39 TaxID=3409790 RepID=UPI003BB78943